MIWNVRSDFLMLDRVGGVLVTEESRALLTDVSAWAAPIPLRGGPGSELLPPIPVN